MYDTTDNTGKTKGESALMLVSARVRYVASTKWGKRAYMNMEHLRKQILEQEEHAVVS
jgi:hypothetical protein